ncbi:MAG: thioredoxin family protein [Candidatus Thalassarchaeaceae archaeon]
MRRPVSLTMAILLTIILSSQSTAHIGHFGEYAPAKMYDVKTFEVDCALTNETCIANQTTHFIEYFSADWCEPCAIVSQELESLNRSDTTIVQHHPSPADLHFYSESNIRLYETYGFWGVPDVVLNGEGLLVGPSQSNELEATLDNFTREWNGFLELTLANGTLSWQADDGHVVHVWITKNRPHEYTYADQPLVVTNHAYANVTDQVFNYTNDTNQTEETYHIYNSSMNISDLLDENVTSIVVTLETPGRIPLSRASTLSSQGYDLVDEGPNDFVPTDSKSGSESDLAIAVFGFMLAAIIPAFIMYIQTARKQKVLVDESE